MTRRIGILGGTFDPIHVGHVDLAHAAEQALELTTIRVVPAHVPPHRPQPAASPFHRFAMVSMALDGHEQWSASDMELREPTPSFTSTTLDRLHREGFEARELYFLIGADAFAEIGSWKDYPAILEKANFAVIARPGFSLDALKRVVPDVNARLRTSGTGIIDRPSIFMIEAHTADVSATTIRQRVGNGESIDGMVSSGVARHIAQHGLYRTSASNRRSGGHS